MAGGDSTATIALYRLPSLLAAIAGALLTWWAALAFGRPRAALMAALFMTVSFVLVSEAKVARAETMVLAAVALSEGALARLWLKTDDRPDFFLVFLFWTGLGIGILTRGVIAPTVVALTVAVLSFERGGVTWLRRLAPLPGAVWLLFLILPWVIALIVVAAQDPPPIVARYKMLAVQGMLEGPPGSYLILSFLFFWPVAVFAVNAVPFVLDNLRRKLVVFMLAWAVPYWIVVELYPDKLPGFVLSACPAVAIIAATAIDENRPALKGWFGWLLSLTLFLIPLAMGGWLAVTLLDEARAIALVALLFVIVSVGVSVVAWQWLRAPASMVGAAGLSIVAAIVFYFAIFGVIVPNFSGLRLGERAVAAARAASGCASPQIAATAFREPSLYLAGYPNVRLTDGAGAVDFLEGGPCRVAIVELRIQSLFNQRAEDLGLTPRLQEEIRGFNVGTLQDGALRVFTLESAGK
jgi:4-amino-4-deoxy-L-arabinose transferase-like glycosyltransferase